MLTSAIASVIVCVKFLAWCFLALLLIAAIGYGVVLILMVFSYFGRFKNYEGKHTNEYVWKELERKFEES